MSNITIDIFILLGFTDRPALQRPLFMLFLLIYIMTLVGNLGMITLIKIDSRLHTPMYLFLSHLALVDFCYSSNITFKTLENFHSDRKTISFTGCFVQMYFFIALVNTECFLLGFMAYDRYVAICKPLLYMVIMSRRLCDKMVAVAYALGFLNSMVHTTYIGTLSFCHSNVIDHFFCEIPPLLKLSCSNTYIYERFTFISAVVIALGSLLLILCSYTYILFSILRIHSAEGRSKAFSTCISHLMAIILFYCTGLSTYLQPTSNYSQDQNKVVSVFYAFVIPMLNPLIYSLRNKEVKDSLKKVVIRKVF
ncbi:olfactory receptor 5F1-like isoform X2 [Emydura macquarii macquarii]|uniref:olfactory receptor 5F1-like isoform X2 n=1 Tax=Emydura macquarii macquarii TaxID=1129001 RepID=UPI00352AEE9B